MSALRAGMSTFDTITEILNAKHARGERSDRSYRGTVYAEAVDGYIVKDDHDYVAGFTSHTRRYSVSHQGKGQKAAIEQYAETLRAGGMRVEVRPSHPYKTNLVVWVMEPVVFDRHDFKMKSSTQRDWT